MQNPLANFIGVFSLVRDDRGFQVNPLCCHDITHSDRQIGNLCYFFEKVIQIFSCKLKSNECINLSRLKTMAK